MTKNITNLVGYPSHDENKARGRLSCKFSRQWHALQTLSGAATKIVSKTLGQLLPFRTSQRGLCNLQSTRDDVGRNEGYCVSHCCFSLFRGKYKGLSDILFCLFPSRFHIHDVDSWHHYVALAFIFSQHFLFEGNAVSLNQRASISQKHTHTYWVKRSWLLAPRLLFLHWSSMIDTKVVVCI